MNTPENILEKHWRGWVEANYGKLAAEEADFEEFSHGFIIAAMEEYAHTEQNSHKHSVMQAEGSDGAQGAAVASEGVGEANTCAGHDYTFYKTAVIKMCVNCGKKQYFDRA